MAGKRVAKKTRKTAPKNAAPKNVAKSKTVEVLSIYIDDTKNFHTYRIALGQDIYGSVGVSKEKDVPNFILLELAASNDPRRKPAIEEMLKGMQNGRAKDRLLKALH